MVQELSEKLSNDNLPHVVILDMNMPEMDGRETAIWLQADYPVD